MNYADAFKIGSKCDGYIKCTYAKLHSPDLGALFSLQRGYFYQNKARVDFNELMDADTEKAHQNSDATQYAQLNTDVWGYLTIDVPIVKAAEHIEIQKENDFVPVALTNEAIQVIARLVKPSSTKTQDLADAIKNGKFYVKACAIDWIPTNADVYVQDPNGQMVKLADRLEAARKRMETAKAILATAATLTII